MDCSICCEKFNKSTYSKINCKTCNDDTVACRMCCKKYLLDNSVNPTCMICKVEWDKEFLLNNFTKTFVNNDIKKLKENILLEKEIAKLPETQEYAQKLKLIDSLNKQANIINKERLDIYVTLSKLNSQHRDIQRSIADLRWSLNTNTVGTVSFSYKCPVDKCNGFLDSSFNCGLCENKICKKCMEIKNETHECESDTIETIKLLKKDTKPCPKCGQLIYKIDGCDQMWCPPCHTSFSWRTGQVETGNIHNPEYYRWMRENNQTLARNPEDEPYDPCANVLPSYNQIISVMRSHFAAKKSNTTLIDSYETITILNMHRLIRHIEMLNTNRTYTITREENDLKGLRAQYLLNTLNKDSWKMKLQKLDKKKEKETKMINVWNLLSMVLYEYIGKIMENKTNHSFNLIVYNILTESTKIRTHCNELFNKIGDNYTCTYPGITNMWIQIDNYKQYLIKQKTIK